MALGRVTLPTPLLYPNNPIWSILSLLLATKLLIILTRGAIFSITLLYGVVIEGSREISLFISCRLKGATFLSCRFFLMDFMALITCCFSKSYLKALWIISVFIPAYSLILWSTVSGVNPPLKGSEPVPSIG